MKLLFDQNLSFRLCRGLNDLFPNSEQTGRAGLSNADDLAIWRHAERFGFVIVTLDADFAELALLRRAPPKVLWLRCGNQPTAVIEQLLRDRSSEIEDFVKDAAVACLEIY